MSEFNYKTDNTRHDQFMAAVEKNIAAGKATVAELEKKAGAAETQAKAKIEAQLAALQVDFRAAEAKWIEMKNATTACCKEFEASVSAATATACLRKSIDEAVANLRICTTSQLRVCAFAEALRVKQTSVVASTHPNPSPDFRTQFGHGAQKRLRG